MADLSDLIRVSTKDLEAELKRRRDLEITAEKRVELEKDELKKVGKKLISEWYKGLSDEKKEAFMIKVRLSPYVEYTFRDRPEDKIMMIEMLEKGLNIDDLIGQAYRHTEEWRSDDPACYAIMYMAEQEINEIHGPHFEREIHFLMIPPSEDAPYTVYRAYEFYKACGAGENVRSCIEHFKTKSWCQSPEDQALIDGIIKNAVLCHKAIFKFPHVKVPFWSE